MSIKDLDCDKRDDPVTRVVRDLSAEEMVEWLVDYHGLPKESADTVLLNLREQYRWHRLQGRLDRNTTAGLVAELLLMRRSPMVLEKRPLPQRWSKP